MSDNNETLYKLAAQVADKTLDALEKFSGREASRSILTHDLVHFALATDNGKECVE